MTRAFSSDQQVLILQSVIRRTASVLDKIEKPALMWTENPKTGDTVIPQSDFFDEKGTPNQEVTDRKTNSVGIFKGVEVYESLTGDKGEIATFHSTINCVWPILKYLVEERGWGIDHAAVLASDLCDGCMNVVLEEFGEDMEGHNPMETNTSCPYCPIIRPEYYEKHLKGDPEFEKTFAQAQTRKGALRDLLEVVSGFLRHAVPTFTRTQSQNGDLPRVTSKEDIDLTENGKLGAALRKAILKR